MIRSSLLVIAVLASAAPLRAEACMPGCSGYHLSFTGPTGAGTTADESVTITWTDATDGPSATFDLIASASPVPVYSMHSFPTELPGQVIALGLSASGQSSFMWRTASTEAGTYFLYAVFHNAPYDTLVMPFGAVRVAHGTQAAGPAVWIGSPRGVNPVDGNVAIDLDVVGESGATATVYVGAPPDASDGTLIATVPVAMAQTVTWNSSAAPPGNYVFKVVMSDSKGPLATAYSPGQVQVGVPMSSGGCTTGIGSASLLAGLALLAFRRRKD